MIGLDTNVLVRHLAGDDPNQSPAARALLAGRTADQPAFISLVTLVEALWTLSSRRYGYERTQLLDVVGDLAGLGEVRLQEHAAVVAAVATARLTGCDLADALVAELGRRAGCAHTATFDRRAAGAIPEMSLRPAAPPQAPDPA
ncbi:MAG: type II toxin-antitoxin system VapC family toxin [Bifidobacteriaceae bacterium]|nr:type II toxin-antitoxin system VapC family toxin [Bifidobacteriaceae bacterium]